MNLSEARLAIVDIETTGRDSRARLSEIALIEVEGLRRTGEWSTLVNSSGAPRFPDIADELFERLSGRLFVAHNAGFDSSLLRREFARQGLAFLPRTLCTVKLARRLYPGDASHDLDSLIERHGLTCFARHRALGDADTLWQFMELAAREHGAEVLSVAARQVASEPRLPPGVGREAIEDIPEAPGAFVFYGEAGTPLYAGAAARLRSRVLGHFCAATRSRRAAELARAVRRIEWRRTVGKLGARLLELRLVRDLAPSYRRRTIATGAIASLDWPYRGPLGIIECDPEREATEVHAVDRWCYLGSATCEAELAELLEQRPRFDYGHYLLLARHLARKGVRTRPLERCISS